jgi:hypothetical protein
MFMHKVREQRSRGNGMESSFEGQGRAELGGGRKSTAQTVFPSTAYDRDMKSAPVIDHYTPGTHGDSLVPSAAVRKTVNGKHNDVSSNTSLLIGISREAARESLLATFVPERKVLGRNEFVREVLTLIHVSRLSSRD